MGMGNEQRLRDECDEDSVTVEQYLGKPGYQWWRNPSKHGIALELAIGKSLAAAAFLEDGELDIGLEFLDSAIAIVAEYLAAHPERKE
jgi:hypothetical protein